jgi:hypothetical protein
LVVGAQHIVVGQSAAVVQVCTQVGVPEAVEQASLAPQHVPPHGVAHEGPSAPASGTTIEPSGPTIEPSGPTIEPVSTAGPSCVLAASFDGHRRGAIEQQSSTHCWKVPVSAPMFACCSQYCVHDVAPASGAVASFPPMGTTDESEESLVQ